MTKPLRSRVGISVPATSANLGPGFDSFGLALDIRDAYVAEVVETPGVAVVSSGLDSQDLPRDDSHLVARSMLLGCERLHLDVPGLRITCRNAIPQSRGMGSSAAAIAGGVALAYALAGDIAESAGEILQLAAEIEGHPDNVAPAVLGGFTIAWTQTDGSARAISQPVAADVAAVLFVPAATSPTAAARAALPAEVPLVDAVHNSARSALLTLALTSQPELLFDATADRLHQEQRRSGYPAAMELVDTLRSQGIAAVVSGAGPTVLVLGSQESLARLAEESYSGFSTQPVSFGPGLRLLAE